MISHIAWTLRERVNTTLLVGMAMFGVTLMIAALYPAVAESMSGLTENLPDSVSGILGGGDVSTLEGWMNLELMSIMAPFVFLVFGGALGAGTVAGHEERGTVKVLLSTPITRTQMVVASAVASTLMLAMVAIMMWLGMLLGDAIVTDASLSGPHMVASVVQLFLLGLLGYGVGLVVGAITGQRVLALAVTVVVGLASFLLNGFADAIDGLSWGKDVAPFAWAVAPNPLEEGFSGSGVVLLLAVAVVCYVVGLVAFNHRDIRA